MPRTDLPLTFDDVASFDKNVLSFEEYLAKLNSILASQLTPLLKQLVEAEIDRESALTTLLGVLVTPPEQNELPELNTAQAVATSSMGEVTETPTKSEIGWLLEKLEIEGFRGINNHGDPLVLDFKTDAVSSISAPNGVGKSSIFDAMTYALKGKIQKLDSLASSEKGSEYYLNLFHPDAMGRVSLSLKPTDGSQTVDITIVLDGSGRRTVTTSNGSDGEALLTELRREFVLLDGTTFKRFIEDGSLSRGRNFSGLLGMSQYTNLRRALDNLSNTRSFNHHFDKSSLIAQKDAATKELGEVLPTINEDYSKLIKEDRGASENAETAQSKCLEALRAIPALMPHCTGKTFQEIDLDACIRTILTEEGGEKKKRHAELLKIVAEIGEHLAKLPAEEEKEELSGIVNRRDEAINHTSGDLLYRHYLSSKEVLDSDRWSDPKQCPTCERKSEDLIIDFVKFKLAEYEKADIETEKMSIAWNEKKWSTLRQISEKYLPAEKVVSFRPLASRGESGELSKQEFALIIDYLKSLTQTMKEARRAAEEETEVLSAQLPPSLVAATTAVETARRLQASWTRLKKAEETEGVKSKKLAQLDELKAFLTNANSAFSEAESQMAIDRLSAVLPVCQDIFKDIMGHSVVPALKKRTGSEELTIGLSEFWSLRELSAQALLSESYRNAFAVSVYLAAASLYGGAPRFMILDDVTSSFDAGHQLNLMEAIRFKFARPRAVDGPQVIILSHDTMLEKLFNTHNGSTEWHHRRLEGNPQFAVMPQAGAINKVRDGTNDLLAQGRATDAAPFVRQYLEYQLGHILSKCKIPVPYDVAFSDDKKMAGNLLKAITDAVDLHDRAQDLVLEASQKTALEQKAMTITSNFISHWATGSTGAYSAVALQTVMSAINDLEAQFQHRVTSGGPLQFYKSLSQR